MKILENIKLDKENALTLLMQFDIVFTPYISKQVDLDSYSTKISNNGFFILAINEETQQTEGFIAYYINIAGKFAYIPFIGVLPTCQHSGVGHLMLEKLSHTLRMNFNSIMLEVRKTNCKAFHFYLKNGFVQEGETNIKWLMRKKIS